MEAAKQMSPTNLTQLPAQTEAQRETSLKKEKEAESPERLDPNAAFNGEKQVRVEGKLNVASSSICRGSLERK